MLNRIKTAVQKNKDRIAYKIENKSITYGELWNSAEKYAQLLKRQGIAPVIIYGHKSVEMIVSILACIIAERTYVPIDVNTPIFRIQKIIDISGASLVIANEPIDMIEHCTLEKLLQYSKYEPKTARNDTVYIMFTSGSTGDPKGVPISKENLNNFVEWIGNLHPLCNYEGVNVLNQANFSFDLSVADMFYALCNGHTLIAFDTKDDYNEVFRIIKEENINVAVMTPTFLKLCLINSDFTADNYPQLNCIYLCGEQLEPKTVRKLFKVFPDISIINAYGPTEATSAVSGIVITQEMAENEKILPVGEEGSFACDIKIIDDEIVLKGKSVFNGYVGNITDGHYIENGINCYKTGDIGYMSDGKLYCKGRKDNRIKYKGYRIEINDIEYNINRISGVEDCAVVAKYNEDMTVKTLKAFVTAKGLDEDYIKNELKKLIPEYMVPKTVRIMDKLPVNQNGKTDRKALMDI